MSTVGSQLFTFIRVQSVISFSIFQSGVTHTSITIGNVKILKSI